MNLIPWICYKLAFWIIPSKLRTLRTNQNEVEMTPANLMVAIRLLVKCDLALETIESGLNVATPGSKY